MGCANTNVLPRAKFGRMEGHRNADKFLADTWTPLLNFDAEVVRVEISLGFVVSLRPKGAAFGQAGSTRPCSGQSNTVQTNPTHNQRDQCFPWYPDTGCSVFYQNLRMHEQRISSNLNQKMVTSRNKTTKKFRIPEQSKLWWLATFKPISCNSTLKHRPEDAALFPLVSPRPHTLVQTLHKKQNDNPTQQKHIETHGCACNFGTLGK